MIANEFYERTAQLQDLPFGPARNGAAERLLLDCVRQQALDFLPMAYMELIAAYNFGGEDHKALRAFAGLIKLWDTRPELFDDDSIRHLLWQFKWAAHGVMGSANYSVAQLQRFFDDMEKRFRYAGFGLCAPRGARFEAAAVRGQENAEKLRQQWLATPRDDFSECPACAIGSQLNYLVLNERWEEVLELGKTQRFECNVEPAGTYYQLSLAHLMLGDTDACLATLRAADAHANTEHGSVRAPHSNRYAFEVLGRGGALSEFQRRFIQFEQAQAVHRLGSALEPADISRFYTAAGTLAGVSALLSGGADPQFLISGAQSSKQLTLQQLHSELREECEQVAAIFDPLNGNTFLSEKLARALEAVPAPTQLAGF